MVAVVVAGAVVLRRSAVVGGAVVVGAAAVVGGAVVVGAAAVVGGAVVGGAAVVHRVPDEPENISVFTAFEVLQAPQSVRAKDFAP